MRHLDKNLCADFLLLGNMVPLAVVVLLLVATLQLTIPNTNPHKINQKLIAYRPCLSHSSSWLEDLGLCLQTS